ncbi:erythromycin esterase family protein [Gelidibacter sp. F2691]|nr:erythromycin esterase family protein [Gelidibacter sp. F2691]
MKKINILLLLLISNLVFSQKTYPDRCDPIFNSNLFSFEGEELENSDSNLSFYADEDYQMNFDLSESVDGKRSVHIRGTNPNATTYATLSIKVPIRIKKKSTIDLSVWVKTDSIHGENSGTMLRLMSYNNSEYSNPSVFEFSTSILKGTEDWTEISLSTILKEDVNSIILSGLMQGKGRAWFDNFKLKINGERINEILFFKDHEEANKTKDALKKYVTPLELTNLKHVSDYVANQKSNVRIVGLGEATHGTREIFNYKIEIIKSLIKNNGVRTVALEAHYANSYNLNNYIQDGKGDSKQLVRQLGYWPYYTVEFQDFIIWLKDYNKNTNDKISIIGVDSQPGGSSLKVLTEKLKDDVSISKLLNELHNDTTQISKKIEVSNQLFQELVKDNHNENILLNAKALSQSLFLGQYEGPKYDRIRDSLMTENIEYILQKLNIDEKIAYWAHDLHVQNKADWTGGFLKQEFEDGYINLGFLLGNGKYAAVDEKSRKLNSDNELKPMKCNSFDALMDNYNYPALLFRSSLAANDIYLKNNLFDKNIVKRTLGALAIDDQFLFLGDHPETVFDLLIYIKDSNPSRLLD